MLIMPPPAFSPTFPDFFFDISGRHKKRYQKPAVSDYFFFDITKRDQNNGHTFSSTSQKNGITFSSTSQKRRNHFFFDITKRDNTDVFAFSSTS